MPDSPQYSLNQTDGYKILRGGLIVAAGAIITYVLDTIPMIDFGVYSPLVVSISSSLLETLRRYLAGQ